MSLGWKFFRGAGEQGELASADGAAQAVPAVEKHVAPPMQVLGERNELLHVRFSYMVDRLEDLKSLSDDFQLLTGPIAEIATELPVAKARILEVEALFNRETQRNRELGSELREMGEKNAALSDENLANANRVRSQQEMIDRLESSATEERAKLAEFSKRAAAAERGLASESENRIRLDGEVATLTAELKQTGDQLRRTEDAYGALNDRSSDLERENLRQQEVIDTQVVALVDLQARCNEFEKSSQERTNEVASLKQKLKDDRADRQQSDHRHEANRAALQAENSSLSLKIEALNARIASTEQALAQTRDQLGEKDVALRDALTSARGGEKETFALNRQVAQLTQSLTASTSRIEDSQRAADELTRRCDMLTKALSAKDAAIESASEKARARAERIEELSKKFEQEKVALEANQRRLVEELENERAERTLAQGALKIARESRASLQRLNESLRRANREMRSASEKELADAEAEEPRRASAPVNVVAMSPRENAAE